MIVRTVLDNGIRLLAEDVPEARSVSVGVWVGCGARSENEAVNGISHFIEHMLFKGTQRRSAYDIASQIEGTGGSVNAFTGKEHTSYYLKLPAYHLALGLEVLADMMFQPTFSQGDIENEKGVVLSEISQLEDVPEEHIHDIFETTLWRDHPLHFTVLGRRDSVQGFTASTLRDFFDSRYETENILISIAGALDHQDTVALVTKFFDQPRESAPYDAVTSAAAMPEDTASLAPRPFRVFHHRKAQQVNVVIGAPALRAGDPRRYTLAVLNAVVGGSMSSRLFQEVRERRGLAYSIGSFPLVYADTGAFCTYAGTSCDNLRQVLSCCADEYKRMATIDLAAGELLHSKEMLKGGFLLGLESTDSRMNAMARNEINFGRQIPPAEVIAGIEAVSVAAVRELAREILCVEQSSVLVLGDIKEREFQRASAGFC